MAAYTALVSVRDNHEPLIMWPGLMLVLGAPLIIVAMPTSGSSALPPAFDPLLIVATILLILVGIIMLLAGVFVTYGRQRSVPATKLEVQPGPFANRSGYGGS